MHRFRPADVGIHKKYVCVPREGNAEGKTDDEAGHVEDDPRPSFQEMGKHHHPDVPPLTKGVGKAAKGQHSHEVALKLISNIDGTIKAGTVDDFGDGEYQGNSHHDPRYPAVETGQIVDKIDYLFHIFHSMAPFIMSLKMKSDGFDYSSSQ